MKSIFKILFIATLLSISCINISTASAATGGIMLEPMRIELNENQRYATITVLNQSLDEKVTYNISTLPMRMNQDGTLFIPKKMTKREMISKSMLKFSPRTATISEGGQQTVRIVVRKPPQLPDGEYLTYIRVGPVNNQKKKKKEAYNKKLPQNTSSLTVDFMVGMRIPVIVNQGTPNAVTTIKSLSLVNSHEGKKLKLTVNRKGNYSSYVGVSIYDITDGTKKLIASKPRLVTFLPQTERYVVLPILDKNFKRGKILVELTDNRDKTNKVIDSKTYTIN